MKIIDAAVSRMGPTIGQCIYCAGTDDLSDEHVIPLALGGNYVLPEASCPQCRDITSAFELKVARGFMRDARIVANFPTRRRRERPKSIPMTFTRAGVIEQIAVPVGEASALLHLPLLPPPALLDGRARVRGVEVRGYETIGFGQDLRQHRRKYGVSAYQTTVDWDVSSFARLVAKIALGFAVATVGVLPRDEVPLLPVILGTADDPSVWLGSMEFTLPIEAKGPTHAVAVKWASDPERSGSQMLVGYVKLFANAGASGFGVVLWRPERADPRVPGAVPFS